MLDEKILAYEPMIYSIIFNLNIKYDKDEYMQIGRIATFHALTKFDPSVTTCTESQFVYTIIKQRLIDQIRKTSRYQLAVSDLQHQRNDMSVDDMYDFLSVYSENLNPKEKEWLKDCLLGYPLTHTAESLGISLSTAKNIRRSAREKLKNAIYL